MGQLLLGIDIGTYSSKGVLCRPDGTIISEARADHDMAIPKPGYAEHDADAVWWSDFKQIAKELTGKVPQGDQIIGIGVSAIGACVLPVDEDGKPLRPGILYGVDTRAVTQIEELENKYTRKALVEFGGTRLTTQAVGPKILWIKQNEPEIYRKTAKFITSTSYVIFKLTGIYVIDAHTASEFNPFINIKTVSWDDRFAEGIISLDQLPEIGWSDEVAGRVTAEAASETGIPEGTQVNFGAVDALSEAVSVGVVDTGELMIMYGSTAFFIFLIEKPVPTYELWLEAGAFKGQYEYSPDCQPAVLPPPGSGTGSGRTYCKRNPWLG
jgi:xylulokinase